MLRHMIRLLATRSLGIKFRQNRLSPAGLALLKVYPDPNNPTDPNGANWVAAPLEPIDTRQDSIRGDVHITGKMKPDGPLDQRQVGPRDGLGQLLG